MNLSEGFSNLQLSLRFIDVLDVGIVAVIVYRVITLIRGTRAMQMLVGLGILGLAFFLSSTFELFTTHWILSYFFDYLVLIVVVLFQDDLRRALTHVGKNPFFSSSAGIEERERIEEIARGATQLAQQRVGALIVIERETGLKNFIDTGSELDAKVSSELLVSIFNRESPIHDGAVILMNGKIAAAGCFLPLSSNPNLDKQFGTRHRAAFGLSEQTDAIVVTVSEETGQVHIVEGGQIKRNLSENEIVDQLSVLLKLHQPSSAIQGIRFVQGQVWSRVKRSRGFLIEKWKARKK